MAYGDGEPWCEACSAYHHRNPECPEYQREQNERGWLGRQIRQSQKNLAARPQWMKNIEREEKDNG
ncbi:MAG TPA: hypothetical protein VF275_05440 [Gammaproteobacteria bacterium]